MILCFSASFLMITDVEKLQFFSLLFQMQRYCYLFLPSPLAVEHTHKTMVYSQWAS